MSSTLGDFLLDSRPGFACGKTDDTGIFQFRMHNVTKASDISLETRRRIPRDSHRNLNQFMVTPGDVLFNATNSPENTGKSILIPDLDEPAVYSNHFVRLRTNPQELQPEYLWRFLQWHYQSGTFQGMIRAWVNQASVSRADLLALPLDPPPLHSQRRIASILDEADAIRAKRRSQLTHLDELPQALFDQIGGEQQQPVRLNEVATFTGGGTLPEGEPFSNQPEGTLLVKVSDMNRPGNSTFLQATSGWTEKKTPIGTTLDAGAVIFPKRGAAIATNKKRITTRQSALDPNLMGVSPDQEKLLTDYLFHWFQSFDLQSIASGSTVPQLNKKDLAPLSIPLPPLREQHAFAEKVTAVRAERDHVARALEADEELFAALQHRAFRGEL